MRLHPYFLIDRHILAFGEYESPLQRFIQSHLKPGAICLDVGANIGAVTLPLAQHCGPSGRVIAFEPNPPVAERLREHVQANGLQQVQVEACALSDTPGEMRLAIASQAHENQGMSSLVEFSHGDLTDSVTVPVQTLDTFAADHQLTRIDFIKVDIQGAEPLFLKGAAHTIERFQPTIAMELAASSLADTHTTAADLVRLLERLGLQGFELGQDGQLGNRIVADELPVDYGQDNAIFLAR